jgi:hypothetical protein
MLNSITLKLNDENHEMTTTTTTTTLNDNKSQTEENHLSSAYFNDSLKSFNNDLNEIEESRYFQT